MRSAIFCIVKGDEVGSAIEELKAAGLAKSEISVLVPHVENLKNADLSPDLLRGSETGAIVGGTLGGLAVATSLLIPGLGFLGITGPLATVLVGALGGTLVGGLEAATGDLARLIGIPGAVAHRYEQVLRDGDGLVSVRYHSDEHRVLAKRTFEHIGATDIHDTGESSDAQREAYG